MTAPTDKAAPIPADVLRLAKLAIADLIDTDSPAAALDIVARAILADREARPSLPEHDHTSSLDGEWFCERHPEYIFGHDGCTGEGITARDRFASAMAHLKWERQRNIELVEQQEMFGLLAAASSLPDSGEERIREDLQRLVKAATEVSHLGAVTGPQWSRLSVALGRARARLRGDASWAT